MIRAIVRFVGKVVVLAVAIPVIVGSLYMLTAIFTTSGDEMVDATVDALDGLSEELGEMEEQALERALERNRAD